MSDNLVNALSERWQSCGIVSGDIVLVHSNVRRTIKEAIRAGYKVTPADIVTSFLNAVGTSGTILFPLFNFDFCNGIPFDFRMTPSRMGVLTETARVRRDAVRTGHPVYSFAVVGKSSCDFTTVNNKSAYADDSPFGILRRANGKIAVLDLEDQGSMTFYHHVEEMKQVDYRYFKDFTADYTDVNGISSERTYQLFVRDIARGVVTDVNPAGELMWKEGLYSGERPGVGAGLRTIDARAMFDFVGSVIDSGKARGVLYSISKDKQ